MSVAWVLATSIQASFLVDPRSDLGLEIRNLTKNVGCTCSQRAKIPKFREGSPEFFVAYRDRLQPNIDCRTLVDGWLR